MAEMDSRLDVTYDRSTGTTRVSQTASALRVIRPGPIGVSPPMLSFRFEFTGDVPVGAIDSITLQVAVSTSLDADGDPMPLHSQERQLLVLLDHSIPFDLGEGTLDVFDASDGSAYAILCYEVPLARVRELIAARIAELHIGDLECQLSSEQQEALRDMIRWTTPDGFAQARAAAHRTEALLQNKARDRHPHLVRLIEVLDDLRQSCSEVWADEWERILVEIPPPETVIAAIRVSIPSDGVFIATDRRVLQILDNAPMLSSLEVDNAEVVRATRAAFGQDATVYAFEDGFGGSVVAVLPTESSAADRVLEYVSEAAGIRPEYLAS